MSFEVELKQLINRYSQENGSDTPDFILASYLARCLDAWNEACAARDKWYGGGLVPAPEPQKTNDEA